MVALFTALLLGLAHVTTAEICKGIQRLLDDPSLPINDPAGGSKGWFGNYDPTPGSPLTQVNPHPIANMTVDYDMRGGACVPNIKNVECHDGPGKANCNEAQTCSHLLDIKEKLLAGGYNCFGRHERTYWQQMYAEKSCARYGNCVPRLTKIKPAAPINVVSRYLSTWGWKASKIAAEAFEKLGLRDNADQFASSPMPRCIDGLEHFAGEQPLNETLNEDLMYTGSIYENMQRKGLCLDKDYFEIDVGEAKKYVWDLHRKLAGSHPAPGKNNWYMTHGFNLRDAFGEWIDEGYWMCVKPNDDPFPMSGDSHVTEYTPCEGSTGRVDFSEIKQFEIDFLLSSESFPLMEACSRLAEKTGGVFERDTEEPKMVLTKAEVPHIKAFNKLLEIQNHALDHVHINDGVVDRSVYHIGLFAHNNGGYQFPRIVSMPMRRILEDTISDADNEKQYAIVEAILEAGNRVNYNKCTKLDDSNPAFAAIHKCYDANFNTGGGWYWGGKDKVFKAANPHYYDHHMFTLEPAVDYWWYPKEYVSGYIGAAACMVDQKSISLADMLRRMGCEAACGKVNGSFKVKNNRREVEDQATTLVADTACACEAACAERAAAVFQYTPATKDCTCTGAKGVDRVRKRIVFQEGIIGGKL